MEFYPQRVYGVEWNDEFVNKLVEWDVEEHGDFSLDLDHGEDLCYMLQDEYEISGSEQEEDSMYFCPSFSELCRKITETMCCIAFLFFVVWCYTA